MHWQNQVVKTLMLLLEKFVRKNVLQCLPRTVKEKVLVKAETAEHKREEKNWTTQEEMFLLEHRLQPRSTFFDQLPG